jgi:crotonobetainyl-CoA:carnitine CoA-transferase CaiB-like acyl-CoA transferase
MGMDYAALCKVKPDIILLSASAFGQYGPYSKRPGFDPIGQAMSGLMMLTGQPVGQPLGTASSIVDRYTALHLTIGALAALRHRDLTGEGQEIDVCLMDSALTMVEIPTSYYLSTGQEGGEAGRPPYKAKDGWVIISAGPAEMRKSLAEVVGSAMQPLPDGSFPTISSGHRSEALEAWCADHTVEEILSILTEKGIVVAPVLSTPQVAKDPHLWEREMLVKMEDAVAGEMYLPGLTIKFSKTPGRLGPVPTPGQHTDEILGALPGYDADRIASLRAAGILGS